jgi:CheY-like chemotaxis protein
MSKRILVVDDDVKILQVIKIMLQHEGFEVTAISDSVRGLELATSDPFDLVILDVMMPQLDGYEFFDRLRADERTRSLPVLLLTAKGKYDIIRDRSRYFLYGLYGFMSKPFFGRELIQKVWDILTVAETDDGSAIEASR